MSLYTSLSIIVHEEMETTLFDSQKVRGLTLNDRRNIQQVQPAFPSTSPHNLLRAFTAEADSQARKRRHTATRERGHFEFSLYDESDSTGNIRHPQQSPASNSRTRGDEVAKMPFAGP